MIELPYVAVELAYQWHERMKLLKLLRMKRDIMIALTREDRELTEDEKKLWEELTEGWRVRRREQGEKIYAFLHKKPKTGPTK